MRGKFESVKKYVPGLILILLGLVIVAFPMLLVAFVSAMLILAGVIAIAVAHKAKNLENQIGRLSSLDPFERAFWHRAEKAFCRRPWR